MAEKTADPAPDATGGSLDLNSLSDLNFGPDWADGKTSKSPDSKRFHDSGGKKVKGRRSGPPQGSRDRRSQGRPQRDNSAPRSGSGYERRSHDKRDHNRQRPTRPIFEPTVKVDLYPQDEAFDALVKRLRASARTYQLFEIAHLLLEKPERYVVVVSPKVKSREASDSKSTLCFSVPGHLPFESEEQAISYVVNECLDLFFDIEETEVEAPSGNFQMVNRCTITGALLGPPNYHRYQEFLQQHYNSRISGMSFERFQSKIESTKEQEDIDAWLESMKKGARYTVKDRQEGEPVSFETLESARHFLIMHRKDKVVGSGESIRFAGRDIERMPRGNLRRSVESYIEQQKHFPLDSANNIRGRLRRHKFAVYKKGAKGVSYVCAVKRRFRDSKTVFTDSIRDLIEYIEKHPEIPASKLPTEYIGVDTEKQKPEELKMKDAAASAAAKTVETDTGGTVEDAPDKIPNTSAEASTQATPTVELTEAEQKKLNQLMLDLRWLITEGYVTEYGDGRLFAPAPLPEPKKKEIPEADRPPVVAEASHPTEPENSVALEETVKEEEEKSNIVEPDDDKSGNAL
ncbi:MAG: hypothetical protein AAF065_02555 [Verrucomicrobiota bacterium]